MPDAASKEETGSAAEEEDTMKKGLIAAAMKQPTYMEKFLGKTTNPRGIPTIAFIEGDVEKFMADRKGNVEVTIGAYTEMLQKYKLMEGSLTRQKASLKYKMPEIDNTLDLVKMLKAKRDGDEEMLANYPLSEVVLARAKVAVEQGVVCLWLGANVMVEYTVEEAMEMLETNAANAVAKLGETNEDLNHLKDQITTLEVNMARVFNHNVKVQRLAKEAEAKK